MSINREVIHKKRLENYIRAKDDNKPYLMAEVFSLNAELTMKVNSENIVFPPKTVGLEAITDVLVRRFSENFENVFTFCFSDSLKGSAVEVSCAWLVVMNEKRGRECRVGCGRYDWQYVDEDKILVSTLTISIEQMLVVDADQTALIMAWVEELSYPFCYSVEAINIMPDIAALSPVREYLSNYIE
jgi:hypothetical protein